MILYSGLSRADHNEFTSTAVAKVKASYLGGPLHKVLLSGKLNSCQAFPEPKLIFSRINTELVFGFSATALTDEKCDPDKASFYEFDLVFSVNNFAKDIHHYMSNDDTYLITSQNQFFNIPKAELTPTTAPKTILLNGILYRESDTYKIELYTVPSDKIKTRFIFLDNAREIVDSSLLDKYVGSQVFILGFYSLEEVEEPSYPQSPSSPSDDKFTLTGIGRFRMTR